MAKRNDTIVLLVTVLMRRVGFAVFGSAAEILGKARKNYFIIKMAFHFIGL